MPPCNRPGSGETRRFRSRSGFALIITISLLAFLVLLLVVLASLTRVETGIARNTQTHARARQNALVGLNIALGRLQANAGPDQRVTATSDLIGATNNRWTGVWDTTNMAASPVWLVSGPSPNPSGAVSGGVQLVGTNTAGSVAGNAVSVATEDLVVDSYPGLSGNQTIGRYAWWVGDEGVKGRLDLRDLVASVPVPASPLPFDPVTTPAQRDRLRQLFQHRSGGDALPASFGLGDEDAAAARWNGLANVIAFNQLKFLFATNTTQRNYLRDNFHDFTANAAGLLANTAAGGLKSNLSDPGSPLGSAAIVDLEAHRPNLSNNTLAVFTGTATAGTSSAQVKPLITEFSLDIVLYREDAPGGALAGRLLMGYWVRAEFVNPYVLPIEHNAAGTADYLVKIIREPQNIGLPQIIGLPTVTVTAPRQPGAPVVGNVVLGTLIPPTTLIPIDFDANLAPGEISRRVSERVQAIDTGLIVTDATVPSTGTSAVDDLLSFSAPAATVTVEFYHVSNPTIPIARFDSIQFPAFNRDGSADWWIASNLPFPSDTNTTHVSARGMSFHHRADTALLTWGDWVNPTSAPFPPDLRLITLAFDTAFWESAGFDPVESAKGILSQFNDVDPVFADDKTLIAFDFTTQRHLSVAGLGMMAFPGARPLSVGSPWGGGLNAAFDSAFFNPVPSTWTPGVPLPNTRHTVIAAPYTGVPATPADVATADAAQFLTVDGAFNVNSTSTNAWTAVLGRAIRLWAPESGAAKKLENPFFVLGQSAQHGDPAVAPNPLLGKRTLTDTLIQAFAAELRTRVRARAVPFSSMSDFVNSGILQQAIDAAGLNAAGAGTTDIGGTAPAPFTPNYLSQAAMLNTLAPSLAARSDTFTIRAFGSVINPVTLAEEGRAWCEAIVQRVPETVIPPTGSATLMDNATPASLGRRFKIVQFRWLTQDDI